MQGLSVLSLVEIGGVSQSIIELLAHVSKCMVTRSNVLRILELMSLVSSYNGHDKKCIILNTFFQGEK